MPKKLKVKKVKKIGKDYIGMHPLAGKELGIKTPKDTILIKKGLKPKKEKETIIHEKREYKLMSKPKELPYKEAHRIVTKREREGKTRNSAMSIYGMIKREKVRSAYSYPQRKRVYSERVKVGSYLRKTGKIIHVAKHITHIKQSSRFTIYGKRKDIMKATKKIKKESLIPKKQYQDRLQAQTFLAEPDKYSLEGDWIEKKRKFSP